MLSIFYSNAISTITMIITIAITILFTINMTIFISYSIQYTYYINYYYNYPYTRLYIITNMHQCLCLKLVLKSEVSSFFSVNCQLVELLPSFLMLYLSHGAAVLLSSLLKSPLLLKEKKKPKPSFIWLLNCLLVAAELQNTRLLCFPPTPVSRL